MTTPLENDPILHSVPVVQGRKKIGSYLLERLLGRGGMGAVYLGHHERLGHDVAVKCLMPSAGGASEEQVQRFWREAKIAANVVHPNLIQVRDLGMEHGLHYMVMDFIDGESAEQRVLRSGPLEYREALTIILHTCQGLAAGHGHDPVIVHRDVKPQNIMISRDGDVRVADLGIARIESEHLLTEDSRVFGTPNYMPLEQFKSAADVTCASDVYSVGAMLCYLLTGEHPFVGRSPYEIGDELRTNGFPDVRELVTDLPDDVAELIRAATAVERSQRPANAKVMAERVRRVLEGLGGAVPLAFGGGRRKRQSALASGSVPPRTIDDGAAGGIQPTIADAGGGGDVAVAVNEPISIPDAGPAPRQGGRGGLWIGALVICSILAGGVYAFTEWTKDPEDDDKKKEKSDVRTSEEERQRTLAQLPDDWAALSSKVLEWPASRDATDVPGSSELEQFVSDCEELRKLGVSVSWSFEALPSDTRVDLITALDRVAWEWWHLEMSEGAEIQNLRAEIHGLLADGPRAKLSTSIKEGDLAQVRHALAQHGELPNPEGPSWLHLALALRTDPTNRKSDSLQILRDLIYRERTVAGMAAPEHVLYKAVRNGDVEAVKALLDAGVDRTTPGGKKRNIMALRYACKTVERRHDAVARELCTALLQYPFSSAHGDAETTLLKGRDQSGVRALEIALERGLVETATYLFEQHRALKVPISQGDVDNSAIDCLLSGLDELPPQFERTKEGMDAVESWGGLAVELADTKAADASKIASKMGKVLAGIERMTSGEAWPAELETRLKEVKRQIKLYAN